jgi:hypothetical protein
MTIQSPLAEARPNQPAEPTSKVGGSKELRFGNFFPFSSDRPNGLLSRNPNFLEEIPLSGAWSE